MLNLVRHEFFEHDSWLRYQKLDKILKHDAEYPNYKKMPTAQSAQQTLRILDNNWSAFFATNKDYQKHKSKYKSEPKPPNYLREDGKFELILTNQNCKIKNEVLVLPKVL